MNDFDVFSFDFLFDQGFYGVFDIIFGQFRMVNGDDDRDFVVTAVEFEVLADLVHVIF